MYNPKTLLAFKDLSLEIKSRRGRPGVADYDAFKAQSREENFEKSKDHLNCGASS